MVFWLPTLIQSWGVKDLLMIGIYAAIPNAVGVVGMILIGRNSDKLHERRWHFAACVAAATAGIALISSLGNLGPAVSPSINGLIIQHIGSNAYSMYSVMAMYVLAGLILLVTVRAAKASERSPALGGTAGRA